MTSEGLLVRSTAASIAAVLHLLVLVAFLAKIHVGLPVQRQSDAHLSDTAPPLIASIVSVDARGAKAADSRSPALDSKQLASLSQKIDVPTPAPVWPNEDDPATQTAQPAPSAGRTGLRCEVHIHQSLAGRVQAIDFGECTGDRIWQHTLLQTIERAAQLIEPTPDAQFPPVRTLTVGTDNLSPIVLAQQLSTTEMFEKRTSPETEDTVHPR